MEKKGPYVRLSAISQGGRPCSASVHVTTGYEECQGPVWSPEGQLPYEYFKIKKKKNNNFFLHVSGMNFFLPQSPPPPPPLSCCINVKPVQCRGQSASLALPSFGYRQGF